MVQFQETDSLGQAPLFEAGGTKSNSALDALNTETELAALCLALDAGNPFLSVPEQELAQRVGDFKVSDRDVAFVRRAILEGADPLGDAFQSLRSSLQRRGSGAVYTPHAIVHSMVGWLSAQVSPMRVIDPGAGSGRFLLAAASHFPKAELIGVEMDPLAALMLRANLSVLGLSERATVLVDDYRAIKLTKCPGTTAFIGNPPYVRHHQITDVWKHWYASSFARLGIKASGLAGLHLHFFLQTRLLAKDGDIGAFITSAEWLDVNYGDALRQLLVHGLGGLALHVLAPSIEAFPGTATTAAITCFRVGKTELPIKVRAVDNLAMLDGLSNGLEVAREEFQIQRRWSSIVWPRAPDRMGEIELGELFRVHRGQVTGANSIWIAGEHAALLPDRVKIPAITKARDLIQAGASLRGSENLRRVIDLPPALDAFDQDEQKSISAFLSWALAQGVDKGYIARHRKAWWSVGLRDPAPILCTYMARRPPQFTLNICGARHINIAHGLYPRGHLSREELVALVAWLNSHVGTSAGRTYAGGLTKFEPKEIERLRIPRMEALLA